MLRGVGGTPAPPWGVKRSTVAGRRALTTSRRCLTSRAKWERKSYTVLEWLGLIQECCYGAGLLASPRGCTVRLMVCSRCIVEHLHELQSGKSPSFLATFQRGTPPFGHIHSGFWESIEISEVNRTTRQTKMTAPIMRCIFFVFVPRWSFEMLLHTWLHCCFNPATNLSISQSFCVCITM